MSDDVEYRFLGAFVAIFFGVLGPLWLLGPWIFEGVPFSNLLFWAKIAAAVLMLFGAWMAIVTFVIDLASLRKTLDPLQLGVAGEVAILVFPYMMYVGTRALLKQLTSRGNDEP